MKRILVLVVLVSGCVVKLPSLTSQQLAAVSEKYPGTSSAMLDEGQRMYRVRCSGCHTLYLPSELKAHDWESMKVEMTDRAKLTPGEYEQVARYLFAVTAETTPD